MWTRNIKTLLLICSSKTICHVVVKSGRAEVEENCLLFNRNIPGKMAWRNWCAIRLIYWLTSNRHNVLCSRGSSVVAYRGYCLTWDEVPWVRLWPTGCLRTGRLAGRLLVYTAEAYAIFEDMRYKGFICNFFSNSRCKFLI